MTPDAVLHPTDELLAEEIEAGTGVRPPFALGAFDDLDGSVRDALVRLRGCAFLPHRDAIRGFVFDVDTGHLREVEA